MKKSDLSAEEIRNLEQLAQFGFAFHDALRNLPDHVSIKFQPFFKKRGMRNTLARFSFSFSSICLAIAKGHSAEERESYLKLKVSK